MMSLSAWSSTSSSRFDGRDIQQEAVKTERKSLGAGEWSEIDGPFERGSGGHNLSTERTSMDQLCQVCGATDKDSRMVFGEGG